MLIWSGLGFIVPLIILACLVGMQVAVGAIFEDERYYQANGWPKLVGMVVAALVIWPVGVALDKRPGRLLVDPKTGEKVVLGGNHTFFFVPVKWWPLVCLGLGVVLLFVVR